MCVSHTQGQRSNQPSLESESSTQPQETPVEDVLLLGKVSSLKHSLLSPLIASCESLYLCLMHPACHCLTNNRSPDCVNSARVTLKAEANNKKNTGGGWSQVLNRILVIIKVHYYLKLWNVWK